MKSIREKIFLCMSMTVVIALTILGIVSVYLNYSSSIKLLEQTLSETATVAAGRVTKELTSYINVAIDAGSMEKLADPSQSIESKKEVIDQLSMTHGFQRGNILGADGLSIFDGKDFSDHVYFKEAIKGVPYVSEPVLSKFSGKFTIAVCAPLWENGIPNTKVIGVVYFVPPETFLNDIVSNINISEHSAAYAINANGVTIADNTMETIMTQNIEEESKTDHSLSELAQIHVKMRQGERGFGPYVINGIRKFSAYAPIEETDGWSMGITTYQSDFLGPTYLSISITVTLLIVSLIAVSLTAYKLANGIGIPIKQCANRLNELAHGNLKLDVPKIKSKDEIGILAEATNSIVTNMRGIITDIEYKLGEMAAGNFDIDINSKTKELYIGDFSSLTESIYKILEQLTNTLFKINQSSEQVALGSEQVSSGAQSLSQGATEQASAVEELDATIMEISDKVKDTTKNVIEARNRSDEALREATSCNHQMQEMISSMSEIKEKSTEIGNIIKTIEDIAFQTNLLALNVAIEAAHAGEAGKSFAVVADEVRKLANKSSESSKNTTTLIEDAVIAVEKGTRIANETEEALTKVVDSTQIVSEIVDKIAEASTEQSISMSQITQGVDQISSVLQTNSATAEKSAAASEELSGQAQLLKNLIGQFKLKQIS